MRAKGIEGVDPLWMKLNDISNIGKGERIILIYVTIEETCREGNQKMKGNYNDLEITFVQSYEMRRFFYPLPPS